MINNGAYDNSFTRLVEELMALPGIGEKTANRLAMYVLRAPGDYAFKLARAIEDAKTKIGICPLCQDLTEDELCKICRDERRDISLLCIVEEPASMIALEKSGQYNGRYHILHGNLSPMQSIVPEDLRLDRLKDRLRSSPEITEAILALNSNPEGEATALYLKEFLQGLPVRVTRIGSGVPVGAIVQYTDPMTLARALSSRHELGG